MSIGILQALALLLTKSQDQLSADATCFQPVPTINDDAPTDWFHATADDWLPRWYAPATTAAVHATSTNGYHGIWQSTTSDVPTATTTTTTTTTNVPADTPTAATIHATEPDWLPAKYDRYAITADWVLAASIDRWESVQTIYHACHACNAHYHSELWRTILPASITYQQILVALWSIDPTTRIYTSYQPTRLAAYWIQEPIRTRPGHPTESSDRLVQGTKHERARHGFRSVPAASSRSGSGSRSSPISMGNDEW